MLRIICRSRHSCLIVLIVFGHHFAAKLVAPRRRGDRQHGVERNGDKGDDGKPRRVAVEEVAAHNADLGVCVCVCVCARAWGSRERVSEREVTEQYEMKCKTKCTYA